MSTSRASPAAALAGGGTVPAGDPVHAAGEEGPLRALWRHKEKLLLGLDVLTVSSTFMFAFYLRFHSRWFTLPLVEDTARYLKGAALLTCIWVFFIWRDEGYTSGFRGLNSPMLRIRSLVVSGVAAISTLMLISFLYSDLLLSRAVYLITTALGLSVMILTRLLIRAVERDLAGRVRGVQRVLLLGQGRQAREFAAKLRDDYPFCELVDPAAGASGAADAPPLAPASMAIERIRALHEKQPFDKIIVSLAEMGEGLDPEARLARLIELLNDCEARGITLYALPDSMNVVVNQSEVASLSGIPLLRLQDAARHPGYAVVKRVVDIVVSLAILAGGMPLWAAIALAVKCTGRGPVFFSQVRIGLHGRPFRMVKFRTMRVGAEREFENLVDVHRLDVPGVKILDDPRVTRVGRWLRRTSLDEIPQLLNVLRGDMTLVGPRPEMARLVARYDAFARRRLKGKPGLTGFQQVMARNEPLAGAMHYDLVYLKEQGLLFDLYILARTVPAMLRGR